MVWFLKNYRDYQPAFLKRFTQKSPIGIDISDDSIRIAQLKANGNDIVLLSADTNNQPQDIQTGSAGWQRWAVETIKQSTANGKFKGKEIIAVIPPRDVFIEYIKLNNKIQEDKIQQAITEKIRRNLPLQPEKAMIKHIIAEEDNIIIFAADKNIISRHLAIYDRDNLSIKSICVWPLALINCYIQFFGRRKPDLDTVVMLLELNPSRTNVVICRHKKLLFARSIQLSDQNLENEEGLKKLILELNACKRQFASMYKKAHIERLIFLSNRKSGSDQFLHIAKQLEMQAQIGDCLAAVKVAAPHIAGVDRRNPQVNWTRAFGLSLS